LRHDHGILKYYSSKLSEARKMFELTEYQITLYKLVVPSGRELNVEFTFGANTVVVMLTLIIIMKMLGSYNGNESVNIEYLNL
jgi:hypothetical protein